MSKFFTKNTEKGPIVELPKTENSEKNRALLEYLFESVLIRSDGCWEWCGTISPRGYGVVRVKGRQHRTHRLFYQLLVRDLTREEVIDHLCRKLYCMNPSHLEPVTAAENTRRGNGVAMINKRKTHCIRGHEFTGISKNGYRHCGVCKKMHNSKLSKNTQPEEVSADIKLKDPIYKWPDDTL